MGLLAVALVCDLKLRVAAREILESRETRRFSTVRRILQALSRFLKIEKKMVRWKSKSTETEIDERNENFDSTRKQPDKQLHPSAAHNEIFSFHSATTAGVAFWYFERRTVCTDSARVAVVYRCVDNDVDRR